MKLAIIPLQCGLSILNQKCDYPTLKTTFTLFLLSFTLFLIEIFICLLTNLDLAKKASGVCEYEN
jgi:hypothetical protein